MKHIFKEAETTRLQPEIPDARSILAPTTAVKVQGKVVMVQ